MAKIQATKCGKNFAHKKGNKSLPLYAVFVLLLVFFGGLSVFLQPTYQADSDSHVDKALAIEEAIPAITQQDRLWLQDSLQHTLVNVNKQRQQEIFSQLQTAIASNKQQLAALQQQMRPFFQQQPKPPTARQLQFALWELSKPSGVLDDCAALLRQWQHKGLFRKTDKLARRERWGREYAAKVEKTALFMLNVVSRSLQRRDMWIAQADEHVQLLYPCVIPSRFQPLFANIVLYSSMRGVLYLPNAGFVFGGNSQRGLDCVGFTNFVLDIPEDIRPRHMAFAWHKQKNRSIHPLDKRHWDSAWEQERITTVHRYYQAIDASDSQVGDVVVLMWEEPDKQRRHGHAFLILESQDGFWSILECNRTNNKRRDGFARRQIPWDQSEQGIATYVLRPK